MAQTGVLKGLADVRFGSLADICGAKGHVCFSPNSGHVQCTSRCPLCANSGHQGPLLTPRFPITNTDYCSPALRMPSRNLAIAAGV